MRVTNIQEGEWEEASGTSPAGEGRLVFPGFIQEVLRLLTEREVSRSWRKLFSNPEFGEEALVKAEALLEELRPESPLRHRLDGELNELRRMRLQKQN